MILGASLVDLLFTLPFSLSGFWLQPLHSRAIPQLRPSMARASNLLVSAVLFAGAFTVSRWAFVAPNVNSQGLRQSSTALAARGGGEYDISDADIQNFYNSLLTLGRCTTPSGSWSDGPPL